MFSNTMAESIDITNYTETQLKKIIRSYTLRAEGKKRYYENNKERFKENMRKQREANPNLDKEQYERKKNDPDFKEKLRAKNAIAYQRRKARLIAQKLAEQSKGLGSLD